MNIQSPLVTTQLTPSELFDFLSQVKNFEKLMPKNTTKFELIDEQSFVFALQGMPEISLQLQEAIPHSKIVLGSASDKLSFTLTGNIHENEAGKATAQLHFSGEFNMMMAMIIKGPITKFLDTLATNIQQL